ncbi:hypothetical protein LXT21_37600 [Myxococcus sp. K38C18041901]|uniref:hypothetical protein n=1 Tax=Myxococcus guangdongensis TaxID=2906760 RepID=UPI0020A7268B|nr:hypothetical protein [Myxococcus guangdongensis]MCP3064505.1 hypothetical protein [Myxococcus guangdongensis]
MAGHWTDTFSFTSSTVRYKDLAYVAMTGDELSRMRVAKTYFCEWDAGAWGDGGAVDWPLAGLAVAQVPRQQMCAVGWNGGVRMMGSGDRHDEQIGGSVAAIEQRGPLKGVRTIGQRVYVVGMGRQVYRRDGDDAWVSMDEGARPEPGSTGVVGFEAVDGFSEEDLYAAGWNGEIWRCDGVRWQRCPSPTEHVLTALCCAEDGKVYAAGRRGLLLRGRNDTWEVVAQRILEDIWDLMWFQGQLYVATMGELYVLKGDALVPVDFGAENPKTFYRLSVGDGVLWSTGAKDILAFDGATWTRIDG